MYKRCLLFYVILMSFSFCTDNKNHEYPNFLIGKWKRVNDKPNQQTFEIWNSDLKGTGYTISEGNKIFEEQLEFEPIQDTLHLKVTGVNEVATYFKFTNQTNSSFTCENQKNEFPKKIKYWLKNDTLKALISSEEFAISFSFVSVQ